MIYLTDYISEADLEKEILGSKLRCFGDESVDKKAIEVLLVWHFLVNDPLPDILPDKTASVRWSTSFPVKYGLLNGITRYYFFHI